MKNLKQFLFFYFYNLINIKKIFFKKNLENRRGYSLFKYNIH